MNECACPELRQKEEDEKARGAAGLQGQRSSSVPGWPKTVYRLNLFYFMTHLSSLENSDTTFHMTHDSCQRFWFFRKVRHEDGQLGKYSKHRGTEQEADQPLWLSKRFQASAQESFGWLIKTENKVSAPPANDSKERYLELNMDSDVSEQREPQVTFWWTSAGFLGARVFLQ